MKNLTVADTSVHPEILTHLANHQLCDESGVHDYLFPKLQDLPSPFLLASMDTAVDIVIDSINNRDDILIWGDYDVDGITGTSLLHSFFQQIGVSVTCHIPNRLTDGYGLNDCILRDYSKKLKQNKLLITVDCGISNGEELLLAKRYGFKTIVTDHHKVPEAELYGDATINPKRPDCDFPFSDLSGVGVAFYLAAGVRSKIVDKDLFPDRSVPNMKSFLGYVAVGTIADIMPLKTVNRILVKAGFEAISGGEAEPLRGLGILLDTLGVDSRHMTSDSISFKVAPAINAAGRLGKSDQPLRLMMCDDRKDAIEFASRLIQLNNRRKQITEKNYNLALALAAKQLNIHNSCLVILGDFHEGVLGIVASKMVERFHIPSLVCCYQPSDRTMIKGSGRAPEGYDLYRLVDGASKFLKNFGGHELAAGFSLTADNFLSFKHLFETLSLEKKQNISDEIKMLQHKYLDLSLSEALDRTLLNNLIQLEPTGEGNPKPVFVDHKARFVSFSTFGKNRAHLKGVVRGIYDNIPVIGFNLSDKIAALNIRESFRIVYNHSLETYNGRTNWRIHIQDISQT